MLRKNIAPVIATILTGILFIVIGSCFSAFLYKKEIIKVEDPKIITNSNIEVFNSDNDKIINLKLSKLELGLKPSTGEEDKETGIPATVSDKKGSEGLFGKVLVYAPTGAKILINNIIISSNKDEDKIAEERENIMVSVKEIKQSTKSLDKDSVELGEIDASSEKTELTFYVWLSGKASKVLESARISFDIVFQE